jgi:hypothetical protein
MRQEVRFGGKGISVSEIRIGRESRVSKVGFYSDTRIVEATTVSIRFFVWNIPIWREDLSDTRRGFFFLQKSAFYKKCRTFPKTFRLF